MADDTKKILGAVFALIATAILLLFTQGVLSFQYSVVALLTIIAVLVW
jgi:hypothetical protein